MKISLQELKKAVQWFEANTNEQNINVDSDIKHITLSGFDRQDREVVITLFADSNLMPKIKKTENL